MPHVSAQAVEPHLNQTLLDLVAALLSLESPYSEMFGLLITDTEKLMWAKRLAALLLLNRGVKQARIARALKMTRITVSRIKKNYEGEKVLVTQVARELSANSHYQALVTLIR